MPIETTVIAGGNLATNRRTIAGVLGQFHLLQISGNRALQIFTNAGLPQQALQEPDFPISLAQELGICSAMVRRRDDERSLPRLLFEERKRIGIENLGVLGMAMRHANTALEALKVCLSFPQLTWGHSRMILHQRGDNTVFTFTMDRPGVADLSTAQIDQLMEYCLLLDLISSVRNIEDILKHAEAPLCITLPFAEPQDWTQLKAGLPCPVIFSADDASVVYAKTLQERTLPRANPPVYRSFLSIAKKMSLMLAEDISLTEQVSRWLWAYTPPLRRPEIAQQLALSERSLTRHLRAEGTSYARLLGKVQRERAENLLRNDTLAIADIAYRLGYTEPAAFTRAFTNWTGMSPLAWRKQWNASKP